MFLKEMEVWWWQKKSCSRLLQILTVLHSKHCLLYTSPVLNLLLHSDSVYILTPDTITFPIPITLLPCPNSPVRLLPLLLSFSLSLCQLQTQSRSLKFFFMPCFCFCSCRCFYPYFCMVVVSSRAWPIPITFFIIVPVATFVHPRACPTPCSWTCVCRCPWYYSSACIYLRSWIGLRLLSGSCKGI